MLQGNIVVHPQNIICAKHRKRLLCLKIQLIQTTQTTLAITARTQAQIILTHLAATKALINQATLITVAKMPATQAAIRVLTAAQTLQTRADTF